MIEYSTTDNPEVVEVPVPIDRKRDQENGGYIWRAACPFCNVETEWYGGLDWNLKTADHCSHYEGRDFDLETARFHGLLGELEDAWNGHTRKATT